MVIIDKLLAANAVVFLLGPMVLQINWLTEAALLLAMTILYAISSHKKRKAADRSD